MTRAVTTDARTRRDDPEDRPVIVMRHYGINAGGTTVPSKSTAKKGGSRKITTAAGKANVAGQMATAGAKLAKGGKHGKGK